MQSLVQEIRAKPGAVADFVGWNLRLVPSGLQVALFGATSTGDNPGYFPVRAHRAYALILSVVLLGLLVAGTVAIRRQWSYWREEWLPQRLWAVILLGSLGVTTLFVALT